MCALSCCITPELTLKLKWSRGWAKDEEKRQQEPYARLAELFLQVGSPRDVQMSIRSRHPSLSWTKMEHSAAGEDTICEPHKSNMLGILACCTFESIQWIVLPQQIDAMHFHARHGHQSACRNALNAVDA